MVSTTDCERSELSGTRHSTGGRASRRATMRGTATEHCADTVPGLPHSAPLPLGHRLLRSSSEDYTGACVRQLAALAIGCRNHRRSAAP